MVLCKGAPEVIEKYLEKIPEKYTESYIDFVKNGARVLALAYRDLKCQADQAKQLTRDETESKLVFCGFIVSECPLKFDTKGVIEELTQSGHEVKMITGDNQLTAAFVAHELNFAPKSNRKSLFVHSVVSREYIRWHNIDGDFDSQTGTVEELRKLSKKNLLCVSGDQLDKVFEMDHCGRFIRHMHVFSRTSPNQKTVIVAQLNAEGNMTLMTGDGTNDVGSLKRADVGLAIVNNQPPSKEMKKKKKEMSFMPPKEKLAGKTLPEQKEIMMAH